MVVLKQSVFLVLSIIESQTLKEGKVSTEEKSTLVFKTIFLSFFENEILSHDVTKKAIKRKNRTRKNIPLFIP
jgi:hypothetical protein